MTSYIISYFFYYFIIAVYAYKEENRYIKFIVHFVAVFQLVMLHELLLLGDNILSIVILLLLIIETTRALSNLWY